MNPLEEAVAVGVEDAGQRLDRWLCARCPHLSRNQVKALLDGGRVLVNRRRVIIAGWELEAGDEVELRPPPGFGKDGAPAERVVEERQGPGAPAGMERAERIEEACGVRESLERYFSRRRDRPRPEGRPGERSDRGRPGGKQGAPHERLRIYHEDRDLLIVEKPAGLRSVPADRSGHDCESLLSRVHGYLRRRHAHHGKQSFVEPLHRLDDETSGIMAFALSREGKKLDQQFRDHTLRREYVAVVVGRVEQQEGVIDLPLEKGNFHGGKKVRVASSKGGRRAVTEFRVKERYASATLLTLRVRTGRTHQIRVHLAEKGHPVVGEKLYAQALRGEGPAFPRHALHAATLGFRHPSTGKKLAFHSPLPRDLQELVESLRQSV